MPRAPSCWNSGRGGSPLVISQTALDICMAAISGNQFKKSESWDFLGDPVCKTSPSNARHEGSNPGWGAKIPHTLRSKTKTENRNNIVTNLIKTLKVAGIKQKQKNLS